MSTIKLTRPIPAHGSEISEITLREPTGADVMELGTPQTMKPSADSKSVSVQTDAAVVGSYISRLGGIPLSSVGKMSAKDFSKASNAVMGFFMGGEEDE